MLPGGQLRCGKMEWILKKQFTRYTGSYKMKKLLENWNKFLKEASEKDLFDELSQLSKQLSDAGEEETEEIQKIKDRIAEIEKQREEEKKEEERKQREEENRRKNISRKVTQENPSGN